MDHLVPNRPPRERHLNLGMIRCEKTRNSQVTDIHQLRGRLRIDMKTGLCEGADS